MRRRTYLLPYTLMQHYPPQAQMLQPAPQSVNPWPQAPTKRRSTTYPAPCIKYTNTTAWSTKSVRGDSTEESDDETDDDDETIAAFTTTSIASSQSRAPGNKPRQQRRVKNWVNDTSHHTSQFKSPFVPPTGTSKASSSGSATHRKTDRHESSDHRDRKTQREPPPIWIPRPTAPQPLRQTVSQPVLFQRPPIYAPPPPMQYNQPQVVWMPVHPPSQPGAMRGNGHVQFVPPPRTVSVTHVVSEPLTLVIE